MKSQFIFILTLFAIIFLYTSYLNFPIDYLIYEVNLEKYITYSFWYKINITQNLTLIQNINQTYYNYCSSIGIICYFNGTHIILVSPIKSYILRAK